MRYFILIPAVIAILLVAGCNNDISNDSDAGITGPSINLHPPASSKNNNALLDSSTNIKAPLLNINQNMQAGNGFNPAHGKPGHRCDIPVGSPLNSQPSQAINSNQPVITNQQQSTVPASVSSANGLNPAHGKPGHRCDIAVGAPLNSKPSQPAPNKQTVNTSKVTPPPATSVTPVLPVTVSSGELNPEHGKPGHRCDIAVGAPLNKDPKQ